MNRTSGLSADHSLDERVTALPRYTVRAYRLPSKLFHWTTVVLVLIMIASGVIMKQLGSGPVADALFLTHKTTGILTLSIVLLRVLYRLLMPDPVTEREDYRRPILHWILYSALIAMPLLGWAGVSDFGSRGILFGIELPAILPQGGGRWEILLEVHAYLAFGMLALVVLHIGVAMQDHMMRARERAESE